MPDDVANDAEHHRYVIRHDGDVAGFAEYRMAAPDRIVLTHTEIDERFEGHGLGSALAKAVLDDIRGRGWQVVPRCPFMADYIRRHPEYADLTKSRA
jgi:predicted GNAT family acetyltransferase